MVRGTVLDLAMDAPIGPIRILRDPDLGSQARLATSPDAQNYLNALQEFARRGIPETSLVQHRIHPRAPMSQLDGQEHVNRTLRDSPTLGWGTTSEGPMPPELQDHGDLFMMLHRLLQERQGLPGQREFDRREP